MKHFPFRSAFILLSKFVVVALSLFTLFASRVFAQDFGCQSVRTIAQGESIETLALSFLGDRQYGHAIVIATNNRLDTKSFYYIDRAEKAGVGTTVCIPTKREAQELQTMHDAYLRAVSDAAVLERSKVDTSLHSIDPGKPVVVVTWMRTDQTGPFEKPKTLAKSEITWAVNAPYDLWTTVSSELNSFCKGFTKEHGDDPAKLTARLEERLGLPPGSGMKVFVEILIRHPADLTILIRPCPNPSVDSTACDIGPPQELTRGYRDWFASQRPSEYPWTSLGYTFDWANSASAGKTWQFVRFGESEYVIRKGAKIEIVSSTPTAAYCSNQ